MHTHNPDSPERPSQPKKRFLPKAILAFFVILAGVTLFLGPIWKEKHEKEQPLSQPDSTGTLTTTSPVPLPTAPSISPQDQPVAKPEANPLEQVMEPLETISPEQTVPTATEQILIPPVQEVSTCTGLAQHLHRFFTELDTKGYVQSFSHKEGTQQHFINLVNQLLAHPPVVNRETDDLYTILTNMAHFFRIIGKENIQLSKAILGNEREKIEDLFKDLYTWVLYENCNRELFPLDAPLDKVYEYAGFFLNTMGGRSYLFRRDSRSRILINYYAVLVVDQMQKRGRNKHGIDLTTSLPLLISEIESSNQLIYKEQYLEKLYDLQEEMNQE